MRHNVSGKKLSRDMDHRKALLRNLSTSLVEHGSVETTLAKAKYVRPFVEKLVTKARKGDVNAVRAVKKGLTRDDMVRKLVKDIAPQFSSRPGGYTRIRKLGRRDGDNAPMARIEWVLKKETKKKPEKVEKKPAEDKAVAKKKVEEGKREEKKKPAARKPKTPDKKQSTKEKEKTA